MDEAAEQKPSFNNDHQNGKDQPFLQTIDDPTENGTPDSKSSPNRQGRPPLSSYMDPEEQEDFAFTSERIEENYPFFGTLMKRENGLFKRKEVINRSKPKNIEYVKERYKGGAYQVRQKVEGGKEQKINFNVSGVERPQNESNSSEQVIDEKFMASLRREIKEEIRDDYDDLISRLEKRLEQRNDELEELARKVRNLNMELAETERSAAKNVRNDVKEFEQKVDRLKEDKRDLEFEVFELKQELKYADADGGFDIKSMLKEAASDPNLRQLMAPILAKLFGGGGQMPQQQAALNGAQRSNPQQPTEPQQNNADEMSDNQQPTNPQPETRNTQPETQEPQTKQEKMQHMLNQFETQLVQNAASSMLRGQPAAGQLKEIVMKGVKHVESNGMQIQPQLWVNIAKKLIGFAIENSITPEKAAETIKPILAQFDGAASNLKFVPASAAAKVLINNFNIDVNEQQKTFLVEILEVFKSQLDN